MYTVDYMEAIIYIGVLGWETINIELENPLGFFVEAVDQKEGNDPQLCV